MLASIVIEHIWGNICHNKNGTLLAIMIIVENTHKPLLDEVKFDPRSVYVNTSS